VIRPAVSAEERVRMLEDAIREHRRATRRIFGSDYGKPQQGGSKSADGKLWALLGDGA